MTHVMAGHPECALRSAPWAVEYNRFAVDGHLLSPLSATPQRILVLGFLV